MVMLPKAIAMKNEKGFCFMAPKSERQFVNKIFCEP